MGGDDGQFNVVRRFFAVHKGSTIITVTLANTDKTYAIQVINL
jgi:hypothetical protein